MKQSSQDYERPKPGIGNPTPTSSPKEQPVITPQEEILTLRDLVDALCALRSEEEGVQFYSEYVDCLRRHGFTEDVARSNIAYAAASGDNAMYHRITSYVFPSS